MRPCHEAHGGQHDSMGTCCSFSLVPTDVGLWVAGTPGTFYDCITFHRQWLAQEATQEAHDCLQIVGSHHQALCSHFLSSRSVWYCTGKSHFADIWPDRHKFHTCQRAFANGARLDPSMASSSVRQMVQARHRANPRCTFLSEAI